MSDKPGVQIMQPEHYADPDEEGAIVQGDIGALTQLNAAEINQQIMTARAYPRSINQFRKDMRQLATLDEDVAKSCLYALKRGKGHDAKIIEGPSARFAEIAGQSWGNCRYGSRIVDIGEEFVTAQGFFYDLQKNMAVTVEVLRRITNREGQRFGADMITVTGNAAGSIALRNALLKGIPKALWNDSYQQARLASVGKFESFNSKRQEMIKAFAPMGVEPAQIFGVLGVKGIEDVTVDHLIFLGGVHTAIKEGDQTVEEAFAVANMGNAGEVTPTRPQRSDFTRKEPAKAQADQAQPAKVVQDAQPERKPPPADDKAARRAQEWEDAKAQWAKELETKAKVRDVAGFRDEIDEQLDSAEDKAWWSKLCDVRRDAIMDKTKSAK